MHRLVGQPLHIRNEGCDTASKHELFQCLHVCEVQVKGRLSAAIRMVLEVLPELKAIANQYYLVSVNMTVVKATTIWF